MKKALLVVDLQKEFTTDVTLSNYNRVLSYIKDSNYDLVIATKFVSGNSNFPKRLNWVFKGNKPLEFNADLILEKTGYGLSESQYNMLSKDYHYDIVGCETDACVLKIAMDLFDREYDFSILKEYTYTNSDLQECAERLIERNVGF